MRLLVDATAYGEIPGGAGLRAHALFGALLEGHRYEVVFLLARETPAWLVPCGAEAVRLSVRQASRVGRWRAVRLPRDGDLLFTDHFPIHPGLPTVLTMHDRGLRLRRRFALLHQIRRAAAVVAVSETVGRAWPVESTVIPNGVELPPEPRVEPGPHLLLCDPGLPHKGATFARRVARAAGRELREVGRGVEWLDQGALWREVASAAAVLCPSTDEGFGMLPLEALGLGRPVIASDIPAHREVLGDAAELAPVGDETAWSRALHRALEPDPGRGRRGRVQAAAYSWSRSAARLDALISSLAPEGPPGPRSAPGGV